METQYTVGELAKRMKVSVRTLQYYDQQGLLNPSGYTEGGRRLYGAKDVLRLQQILSLKYLGLSLDEIRDIVPDLDNAKEVGKMLEEQMRTLERQIDDLQRALVSLRAVHEEIGQNEEIDFTRIANIVIASRLHEEGYWWNETMFKNRTGQEMKGIIQQRAKQDLQFGLRVGGQFEAISEKMYGLVQQGADPTGEEGQRMAKELWNMIQDFTGGDAAALPSVARFGGALDDWPDDMKQQQVAIEAFMGDALEHYLRQTAPDALKMLEVRDE